MRYRDPMLECSCGKRFRSLNAEAFHRHNFPTFCRKPKGPRKVAGQTKGKSDGDSHPHVKPDADR